RLLSLTKFINTPGTQAQQGMPESSSNLIDSRLTFNGPLDTRHGGLKALWMEFALPDDHDLPSELFKFQLAFVITLPVSKQLGFPPSAPRCWPFENRASR